MKLIDLALCFVSYLNVVTASTRFVNVTELMKILDKIHPTILQHDLRSYLQLKDFEKEESFNTISNKFVLRDIVHLAPYSQLEDSEEEESFNTISNKPVYGDIVHLDTGSFYHEKEKLKKRDKWYIWNNGQDKNKDKDKDKEKAKKKKRDKNKDMVSVKDLDFSPKMEKQKPHFYLPLKLPQNDDKPVYGNLENLGITYSNTTAKLLYTGFRRGDYVWANIINNNKKGKKKSSKVIVIQPKLKPKKHKLRDKILKYLDYLKTMDDSVELKNALKLQNMKENKLEKKIQDLLDSKGQIEFNVENKNEKIDKNTNVNVPVFKTNDDALKERSKRIQNFLNAHIPVFNTKPRLEDNSTERKSQVEDYLNYHIPGGREKLSLDEKTKHIQDFLNKKSPLFVDVNSLKDSKGYSGDGYAGQNLLQTNEDENNANELVDPYSTESSEETDISVWRPGYRRAYKKKKHRNRDSKYEAKESDTEESASSDYDKNPGNPFTVHKNKYKKNWLWNHFMDGDHMNINPFGPLFANMGPSGADLFFGRKWWYYNQDDYKPLG